MTGASESDTIIAELCPITAASTQTPRPFRSRDKMAGSSASAANSQMAQLDAVRQMALVDPNNYKSVLTQIMPIFQSQNNPSPALQAWGADFIAEAFSSPAFPTEDKQEVSIAALPVLKELLELPPGQQAASVDQTGMVKSTIQAASSIYPHVFRHM